MKRIEIDKLKTVKTFAMANSVTTAYIYKLIKEGKMKAFVIDGVNFIDTSIYPTLHSK